MANRFWKNSNKLINFLMCNDITNIYCAMLFCIAACFKLWTSQLNFTAIKGSVLTQNKRSADDQSVTTNFKHHATCEFAGI